MPITFSTAWYVFKAKFDPIVYKQWIDNMLSNVNNYYLVIYTDDTGFPFVEKYSSNPKIKIVKKPYTEFYTYQYVNHWITNHEHNDLLKNKVDWKLNMLWSEKINFVYDTMQSNYFQTDYFGWCDIGYFRGNVSDLTYGELSIWPTSNKILCLDKSKVYYACVNNNYDYIYQLKHLIQMKNDIGLPRIPIPANQLSIAGGFFLIHKSKMAWWHDTFYKKLALYFKNNYLVKDDQIIVADCIFSEEQHFQLIREQNPKYDNWFLFQRYLL